MSSLIKDSEHRYPAARANREGMLPVSSGHSIYWAEYGNPMGTPVMFVHGGPGGASAPKQARFFDPDRYRIVLFDQRGCGKSTPSVSDDDPLPGLAGNTTNDLIGDMNALKKHLDIDRPMILFGGSWGSTLSLAYAEAHPEDVSALVLRGIFLCRKPDLDYFYQGNAADTSKTDKPGTYLMFPDAWQPFVDTIPQAQRGDMVKAYADIFAMTPQNAAERTLQDAATNAWSKWEDSTSYLETDGAPGKLDNTKFARAFAMIENHYFMNGAFLGGKSGAAHRDNNVLLDNVHKIKDIPVHIVHGRYDQVCPLFQAEALVAALKKAGAKDIDYRVTTAGHSMFDRANYQALVDITDGIAKAGLKAAPRVTLKP